MTYSFFEFSTKEEAEAKAIELNEQGYVARIKTRVKNPYAKKHRITWIVEYVNKTEVKG